MPEKAAFKYEAFSLLKATVPFNYLDDKVLTNIIETSKTEIFSEGSYIFREGDRSKHVLFFILEGQARALTQIGKEETVTAVRNKGDFFGITVLSSDEPYPLSMMASKDLTCMLISRQSFKKALASNEEFADYITGILATRLKELYQTITDNHDEQRLHGQSLRQRIADIATEQVITCLPMDKVSEIASKMSGHKVSSVVVASLSGKPVGIITEKDLVNKVLAQNNPDLEINAHEIMSTNLITVRPNDFSYQAPLMMTKHNIQHVIVTDNNDVLRGIVTIKDLIRTSNSGTLSIVKQIEYQDTIKGLAALVRDIDQVQQALLAERAYASEICALINELYERINRKVVHIAEAQMVADGWGMPPLKYCFFNMGSAGRKEQFARTDQDNGIIFEDSLNQSAENAANYFLALGKRIVNGLEACGLKRCTGGVMANNRHWCLPLSIWKNNVRNWVDKLDPKDIRNMTIFLDYRYLAGDESLFDNLSIYTSRLFQTSRHALLFMAEDDLKQKVPLNLFRQIITERKGKTHNKLNLKNAVMVHMVDCLRLFALREGIRETNSFERIRLLKEKNIFKPDDAEYFEAAYESLLLFRIKDAFTKIKDGLEPDNLIDLKTLSKKDLSLLKESMLIVSRLQSLTSHTFRAHKA
ncbi:MAG: DUF294 nucleotidyltransferase-like domain-containing protein [Bacillota bacterium]|nr:DUF294 nucleotidyltransferase-like domain-containing protein [Bacillota bacterium]